MVNNPPPKMTGAYVKNLTKNYISDIFFGNIIFFIDLNKKIILS